MSPSSYYALLFNLKVSSGEYSRDYVKCFCGSDNYKQITQKDRYGIDYQLCLCNDCGLLYSNPRMTDESFRGFYKNDYRAIYSDRVEISEMNDVDKIKKFTLGILGEFELPAPKVVFEIGCGIGSNLSPFKECICVGVDYDTEAIKKGRDKGLDLREGGIGVLEQTGLKADLIIMNHVLEHMTDIERDLKRIRGLLSDTGVLYVAVPPFYVNDKYSMFQNAHNYQFTGNTLNYVMRVCGFADFALDENIESLWHKADFMDKGNKFRDEAKTVETFLTQDKFLMPNVRLNCKFTLTNRRNNIKNAVRTGFPEISSLVNIHPDSEGIIISGGSSIESYEDKIKELQSKGAKVYAIERMYKWCINHGITPDYIIALDSSDDVVESFDVINPGTVHILVSQAPPEVFEKLRGYKTYFFHLMQKGIDFSEIYKGINAGKSITFINSGSSVSLCCMTVAMTLGARNLHIFGFDCHVNEKNYADGITGVGCINDIIEVEIDGRVFKTISSYFAFMQQFFQLYQIAKDNKMLDSVRVYGDSMVKQASKIDLDGDKERKV